MTCRFLPFLILTSPLFSQVPGNPIMPILRFPPPEVTRYLELNTEQTGRLTRINSAWQSYLISKMQRVSEVNLEIQAETAKPSLDAVALGQRYLELEAICRESKDRQGTTRRESRAVLNPAQLTKLAALEEAFTLMPIIQGAQESNLMSQSLTTAPVGFPEGNIEVTFSYVRSIGPVLPGCRVEGQRIPAIISRDLDFTPPQP